MAVNPIPEGYHTLTPYLSVRDANAAIGFYTRALGARELFRMNSPDGKIGHAELQIGSSRFMLADESPAMKFFAPGHYGGSPINLMIYVADADAVFKQALAEGAREDRPLANQFYGDRSGSIIDPFGYRWHIATHVEDVSPEEMDRRMKAMSKPQ